MKQKSTVSNTRGQRDIRVQVLVRRVATRRDKRRAVSTTCIIRTNTRKNIPSTMMPTRAAMRVNTENSKKNNHLPKEATRREATLMLLIIKVNMERRGNSRKDRISANRKGTKERKVLKVIMVITRIFPRRVATVKDLLMDTAVVTVMVAAMVAVMVASMEVVTATNDLPKQGKLKSLQANILKYALQNKTSLYFHFLACCKN
jgi:hypothetical protein